MTIQESLLVTLARLDVLYALSVCTRVSSLTGDGRIVFLQLSLPLEDQAALPVFLGRQVRPKE